MSDAHLSDQQLANLAWQGHGDSSRSEAIDHLSLLGEPERAADWQLLSKRMQGILIQSLESSGTLRCGDSLVFLTGSVFHRLPFPALSRDHLGVVRFLVQDYVLSRATTFETFRREKLHAEPAPRKARLAWGVDRPNSGDWGQLRIAQQEVLALGESFGFRARTGRADEIQLASRCLAFVVLPSLGPIPWLRRLVHPSIRRNPCHCLDQPNLRPTASFVFRVALPSTLAPVAGGQRRIGIAIAAFSLADSRHDLRKGWRRRARPRSRKGRDDRP